MDKSLSVFGGPSRSERYQMMRDWRCCSFWCGPHSTSAGIGLVPDTYADNDLGWPIDRWKAAREEAAQFNFIQYDEVTETVLVCGYLAANRPANAKHKAAIVGQINAMECDSLREAAAHALVSLDGQGAKAASLPERKSDLSPQFRSLMEGRQ